VEILGRKYTNQKGRNKMNSIPQLLKFNWIQDGTGNAFACQGIWLYKMSYTSNTYFRTLLSDAFKSDTHPSKWEPVDLYGIPINSAKASCTTVTLVPPAPAISGFRTLSGRPEDPTAASSLSDLFNPAELIKL